MESDCRTTPTEIAPNLAAAIGDWQRWLKHERRYSPHTLSAYSLDLAHFLRFMSSHLAKPVSLADLDGLQRSDYRAWLAARQEQELKASSTARALSMLRSFVKHLTRHGKTRNAILSTIRTPRVPHSIPKALSESDATLAIDAIGKLSKFDWIGKRDAAIMLLLYGCGLALMPFRLLGGVLARGNAHDAELPPRLSRKLASKPLPALPSCYPVNDKGSAVSS